jgi:hypothetical protein
LAENMSQLKEPDAVKDLVSDLHWQIDQMGSRGIKNEAGHVYVPHYYKRGLDTAIERGDQAVIEYVRGYLYRTPSDGYEKLEDADSLDLALRRSWPMKPSHTHFCSPGRTGRRQKSASLRISRRSRIERRTSALESMPPARS